MKKKHQVHWQKQKVGFILSVLFFAGSICFGAESGDARELELQEARVARAALEREKIQLTQELAAARQELDQIRSLYADTLIRQSQTLEKLKNLELAAAHLLQSSTNPNTEKQFAEVIDTLASVKRRILDVEQEFAEFEKSMAAALDGMQPSGAMRREVESRIMSLRRVIESSLNPLSLVAGRGSGDSVEPGCQILSVDKKTQSIILNKGFQQGLRSGMIFCLERAGKIIVEVKVIECRTESSAAIIVNGSWAALLPGVNLKLRR
ncbi:MAG: hypothetical protein GX927_05820 [Lentisphaerae bacterium]|jgi:hypothetical protein|nr:hypothetical protein [Lentisphaerota bacterium]